MTINSHYRKSGRSLGQHALTAVLVASSITCRGRIVT
jgi:hypothetical protein